MSVKETFCVYTKIKLYRSPNTPSQKIQKKKKILGKTFKIEGIMKDKMIGNQLYLFVKWRSLSNHGKRWMHTTWAKKNMIVLI